MRFLLDKEHATSCQIFQYLFQHQSFFNRKGIHSKAWAWRDRAFATSVPSATSSSNYWPHTRFAEYIAIPEPAINPEKGTSKVPDVGFYPFGAERPVVVIELSDSESASTDFPPKLDSYKRTWQLMDYGFVELFHFDFYLNTATRYDFKDPMCWGGAMP